MGTAEDCGFDLDRDKNYFKEPLKNLDILFLSLRVLCALCGFSTI